MGSPVPANEEGSALGDQQNEPRVRDETPRPIQALLRGLTKRCPWCGQGKLFSRWLTMPETCPRCGLRFEREEGAFLGSLSLNYGVTGLAFIVLFVTFLVLTLPDPPLLALTVGAGVLVTALPLLLYPFTKTTWAALDLILHAMDRGDETSRRRRQ